MMIVKTSVLAIAGLAAVAALSATAAGAAELEVSISGLRSAEGRALVALHRRGNDFPSGASVVAATSHPASTAGVRVVFPGLAPGNYAVAAFHDADGDGKLGQNIMRIPTEGFGFSKGAVGIMGPPSFDEAAVTIGPNDERVSVDVPIAYPGS